MQIRSVLFIVGVLLVCVGASLVLPLGVSLWYGDGAFLGLLSSLVIMVGGCVYTFAAVLDNALVVLRRQYVLVIAYALTWIYIKLTAAWLVGEWAVMGASLAYCTAMAVYLLLTAVLFVSSYRRKSGEV